MEANSVSADYVQTHGGHGTASSSGRAEIDGFSHLVLESSDLDRSERFYQDVIGLEPIGRGLIADEREHSVLRMNTGQLIILVKEEHPVPIRANTTALHHAFLMTVEQYRLAQERFEAAGFDTTDARAAFRARGEYSMDIWDPDGHLWQVQAFGDEQHSLIKPDAGVVDCGPAAQYAVGSVTTFGSGNFFLVRSQEGFLALSRWCRHANGLLSYQCEHWRFYCAFHGATYNLRGDHTGHLANIPPLRANRVTVDESGHILVDTDVVDERTAEEPATFAGAPTAAPIAVR
jgi:catechol 2,3-dioxygenase-like lactoylglutathione lyase family enzyme